MNEYELEDTTEIAVADNPISKVLVVIAAVLTAICIFYFATELTRPEPGPKGTPSAVVSTTGP